MTNLLDIIFSILLMNKLNLREVKQQVFSCQIPSSSCLYNCNCTFFGTSYYSAFEVIIIELTYLYRVSLNMNVPQGSLLHRVFNAHSLHLYPLQTFVQTMSSSSSSFFFTRPIIKTSNSPLLIDLNCFVCRGAPGGGRWAAMFLRCIDWAPQDSSGSSSYWLGWLCFGYSRMNF